MRWPIMTSQQAACGTSRALSVLVWESSDDHVYWSLIITRLGDLWCGRWESMHNITHCLSPGHCFLPTGYPSREISFRVGVHIGISPMIYSSPSILQPSILRPPLIIRLLDLIPKGDILLNDLYFKTTCNIRPHFLGPMGGLRIEGPLYKQTGPIGILWLYAWLQDPTSTFFSYCARLHITCSGSDLVSLYDVYMCISTD